ncbi:composite domain of metallo-dependent hydrolase [Amylostereum chailletii]|nr:composite domain of metallo-dependent hydrolase [Amylostereum chailletii]
MEKATLALPTVLPSPPPSARPRRLRGRLVGLFVLLVTVQVLLLSDSVPWLSSSNETSPIPLDSEEILARCLALDQTPGPSADFHERRSSDRYAPGTPATLIRNARIWTGGKNGTEVVEGDVYVDGGIIKGVGHLGRAMLAEVESRKELVVVDAGGAWLTPGIVDPHSHLGDASSPSLDGASGDDNSLKGTIQPWLRSLDGLNTHDDSYELSIAGGVTTALVLPGSANGIGGQAFAIKLRKTKERSPTSMLVDPPFDINGTAPDGSHPLRWRWMKHACGENPSRVYGATRMDTFWAFRQGYDKARQIKEKQDGYCSKALSGQWKDLGEFPDDLQWEALVDVLRGRVRVQTHCYEAVDLDDLIRLTNEFKFPVAAVHHASEAYLVPDVLKRAYGHPPAVALFATNGRYKREAYRASEFAPRILSDNGLKVVMKSDHPVLNSRYLLYEAQQAHYYGLPENLALAAVTSFPAQVVGLDHRVGYVKEGWDADLVLWDSHPLALGATPSQVYIDGIPQLKSPYVAHKPNSFQKAPEVPNFDHELEETLKYDGLPPLAPNKTNAATVLFINVKNVVIPLSSDQLHDLTLGKDGETGVVVVRAGNLVCYGAPGDCLTKENVGQDLRTVDLRGGSITRGLTSFGSPLGLEEIDQEPSTGDGAVFDPLVGGVPKILGGDESVIRAVDGLQFGGRSALLAYRSGVTRGITAPNHRRLFGGLGTAFSLGAAHKLEKGAVLQEATALHVTVAHFGGAPSVSTQIATLRKILLSAGASSNAHVSDQATAFANVVEGRIPLVVEAYSADIIATLIMLKKEVEDATGQTIKLTIVGATEAHILAAELSGAGVGVVFVPSRPFPATWEQQRVLPGPPLTKESEISLLLAHNVTVGVGVVEAWDARNARFDIAWAALEADGRISKTQALALASTDLEKLLGVNAHATGASKPDLVATEGGGLMEFGSKVVGVISAERGRVDLF